MLELRITLQTLPDLKIKDLGANNIKTPLTDKSGHLTSLKVMSRAMLEICYSLKVLKGGVSRFNKSTICQSDVKEVLEGN